MLVEALKLSCELYIMPFMVVILNSPNCTSKNETLLFVFNCRITGRIQPRVPLAKAGR